jgi:hypothetical protein
VTVHAGEVVIAWSRSAFVNMQVNPLVAALVIVLAVVTLGVKFWADGEAKAFGGPAEMRVARDGHLFIQIDNQLLEHDDRGVFIKRHDLGPLGVTRFIGGFDFFANGDVLLRRGVYDPSFIDNLRAYQRKTNQLSLTPDSPDAGLARCDLTAGYCERFGDGIDFKSAYGVAIDRERGDVYFSDTSRHVLRKFSAQGQERAVGAAGFKFPNHIAVTAEGLLVADTNHHAVKRVTAATESFADTKTSWAIDPADAKRHEQTWTRYFAKVDDQWLVINMMNTMSDGGVYVFDSAWEYLRRVELPANADPIAIVAFGDRALVSDYNNDVVYELIGNAPPTAFVSEGLTQALEEQRGKRQRFETFGYLGMGAFGLVMLMMLFVGLRQSS